jgi:hypothetical protein
MRDLILARIWLLDLCSYKSGVTFGAWAPHSFDAAKKVLEEEHQDEPSKEAEDYFESTLSLQYLATKSSGACQTRGYGTVYIM